MPALTPADLELLSAYLDNELTPAERAALERRLAAEPALVAELEALRSVVVQARALPLLKAPRDFRLDPAIYGRPVARPAARRALDRRVTPVQRAYRWSSAISALAAVLVLALGVMGLLRGAHQMPAAVRPPVADEMLAVEPDASAVAALPTQALTASPTPTPTPARTSTLPSTPTALASVVAAVEDAAGIEAAVLLTDTPVVMALEAQEAPAQPAPTQTLAGQPAPSGMGGTTYKETPEGLGGGAPGALQPQSTPAQMTGMVAPQMSTVDSAAETGLSQGELEMPTDAEAFNAASAPGVTSLTATGAAPDSGQRLVPTATKPPSLPSPMPTQMAPTQEVLAQTLARDAAVTATPPPTLAVAAPSEAVMLTGTPLALQPTPQPAPAEPARVEESRGDTWTIPGLPSELLIGGGLALLALSGLLYALGRRAG